MVNAAAKTGSENASKNDVMKTDHTNSVVFDHVIPFVFIFITVTMKLIAPRIDEIPAIWSLKIPKSTAAPEWNIPLDRGG